MRTAGMIHTDKTSEQLASALEALRRGLVIPALPLALTAERRLDERRQRALLRYYFAAGAGGIAAAVHTTQFAIREVALFEPLLRIVAEECARADRAVQIPLFRVGGVCGATPEALREAETIRRHDFHAALLSLAALRDCAEEELLTHCRAVSEVIPLVGFYLQPSVGGRVLSYAFWRGFCEIENVVAIKVAPFNRYQTLDVMRAVAESGRTEIALYTGNDDHIVGDLVTPFRFEVNGQLVERRFVGGLLGHWAVWTRRAVELLAACHDAVSRGAVPRELLRLGEEVTDANAALFDAAHAFRGCIPGVHEVLRREGLFAGIWCLDPVETLSPGQAAEIDRISRAYPHLSDRDFVRTHLDEWLRE